MKYTFVFLLFLMSFGKAISQVQVGIYHSDLVGQIGIGSDFEKKFFGELRFLATDRLELDFGVEAIGQYNFYRSEWYNLHGGLMLGLSGFISESSGASIGLPFGATVKPISSFRRLGILMEATPYIIGERSFLRANLGLRLRLGGD
ncbi:hypothetical protein Aoki45_24670 [Algoriphagus sp. oki45]|uniref:hypothetical protein n=1 Tax=Algoriphagus sp. oki45 TaxID=3067294 RepID=UPI0027E805D9|nr:hypothetical protein Aoki45_24670 [Algoriphagus sp. oki45]